MSQRFCSDTDGLWRVADGFPNKEADLNGKFGEFVEYWPFFVFPASDVVVGLRIRS